MRQFRLTKHAEWDLDEMWDYIAADNPAAADAFVDRFFQKCTKLAAYPLLGRSRADLISNLRSLPLRPYVIFYKPVEDGVEIWRVLHGARNITANFFTRP